MTRAEIIAVFEDVADGHEAVHRAMHLGKDVGAIVIARKSLGDAIARRDEILDRLLADTERLDYMDFLLDYDGTLIVRKWDHDGRCGLGSLNVLKMAARGGADEGIRDALTDAMKDSRWREIVNARSGRAHSEETR